jgi:lactoylglutathione lyase
MAARKPRLIGMNHVALEVGDVDEALAFYGRVFDFTLRGRSAGMAFIDMGDQFIALSTERSQPPDRHRHFGLVVDDKEAALSRLREEGVEVRGNDFLDPWGNRIQVVEYGEIQFTKAPSVVRGMGIEGLEKSERALAELRAKDLA